ALQVADLDDRLVRFRYPVADLRGEPEALLELGHRDALLGGSRIHVDLEVARLTLPVHPQADLVRSGEQCGPDRPGGPEDPPLEVRPCLVTHVPGERVRAGGTRWALRLAVLGLRFLPRIRLL